MEDSTIREYKISFLQHEYNRYSTIIYNLMRHIESIYKDGFIQHKQRLASLNSLNQLIKYMNQDVYNNKLKELKNIKNNTTNFGDINNDHNEELNEDENITINKNNKIIATPTNTDLDNKTFELFYNIKSKNIIHQYIDIYRNNKSGIVSDSLFNEFNEITEKIIKISEECGFASLYQCFELIIGGSFSESINNNYCDQENHEENHEENRKEYMDVLALLNDTFTIIKFNQTNDDNNKDYSIKYSIKESNNQTLLQPYLSIEIKLPFVSKKLTFEGYFKIDSIQTIIRTCQIGNNYIYKKKKIIQNHIDESNDGNINHKFINIYTKHLTLGEILTYTKSFCMSKIQDDYDYYIKISTLKFPQLMDEFMKTVPDSIRNMYRIIKLLLYGPDNCINFAGLLFGVIKDKKNGSEIISDIIYNNLNYMLQTKLNKSKTCINNELDKLKTILDDDIPQDKILAASKHIPPKIKKIIHAKLQELKSQNSDNTKNKIFVDTLMRFPFSIDDNATNEFTLMKSNHKKSRDFMTQVIKVLDDKIYGHTECKSSIRELICSWIMNPSKMGKAISLCGPPGVGKTLIAKALGKAMGLPVRCISLCGMEDGATLLGHSFTYTNAQPGTLVREMCEVGQPRCIIFLDEVDKTSKKHYINEIQNILIQLTDPNMNNVIADKFFQDVTFDFSKVLFILTYNNRNDVDNVLLNRLHEIEVKSYTIKDKLKIAKGYLIKEIAEDNKIDYESINISDDDLSFLVENYTYESGVRELKRVIEKLIIKLNLDLLFQKGSFSCECKKLITIICTCDKCDSCDKCKKCQYCNYTCDNNCKIEMSKEQPITITREMIIKYLNKPRITHYKIHPYSGVGIVNGLYATTSGNGGLVPIYVQKNPSVANFELNLTGLQGETMKESVTFARITAINILKEEYVKKFIENNKCGISVHALDGATKKDGPSAGCAFTVAIISLILEKSIKNTIAMTGEVGIDGECKKIGGLTSKLYGAKKAGANLICIPRSNEDDYEELKKSDPELFNSSFTVILCDSVYDILPLVMEDGFDTNIYLKEHPNKNK